MGDPMSESFNTAKPAVPVGNERDGPVTVPARAVFRHAPPVASELTVSPNDE